MDVSQSKKAALRSLMKMTALKKEKKINSPLVRYNESGQPVCKVCNVNVKSEGVWMAHMGSKGHKEAVEHFKNFAKSSASARLAPQKLSEKNVPHCTGTVESESGASTNTRKASSLPPDFFELPTKKSAKIEIKSVEDGATTKEAITLQASTTNGALPEGFFEVDDNQKGKKNKGKGKGPSITEMTEEMKEFEKAVKDELTIADLQQEEDDEEMAAARQEEEEMTQKTLLERVELLRRKREAKVVSTGSALKNSKELKNEKAVKDDRYEHEDEGEDEDDDEEDDEVDNLMGVGLMNWRARQI